MRADLATLIKTTTVLFGGRLALSTLVYQPHSRTLRILAVAWLGLSPTAAEGRTWNVNANGTGDAPTIEAAIHLSSNGDTILAGSGRYHEDFSFLGKDIVVKSVMGPASTILDGSQEDSSIVMFDQGETNNAILEGFTLTGGNGTPRGGARDGGAIFVGNSSPTIQYNVLYGNAADWGGGIIIGVLGIDFPSFPTPVLRANTIVSNDALHGGGGWRVDGLFLCRHHRRKYVSNKSH